MFAYLTGNLTYKSPAIVHLDVAGTGYEINISLNTYSAIQQLDTVKLYIHLQVREDAHILYGFAENSEKEMFLQLTSVSGVGAAIGRMMLSSLKPSEIGQAILDGNVRLLESVKGIGKKTAERLVLELKDKVKTGNRGPDSLPATPKQTLENDALIALTALGISKAQAENALQKVIKSEPEIVYLEVLIKKALKVI